MESVKYEDFAKLDLRVARILDANMVDGADKLVALKVSLGDEERQIVAGIKQHYAPQELIGMSIIIVANLEPRTLRGVTSHGMLLAASDTTGALSLLTTDKVIAPGAQVK